MEHFGLEEYISVYTDGGCKLLAVTLLKTLGKGELYQVQIGDDDSCHIHFVVKLGDKYVDVMGLWSEKALLAFWKDELGLGEEELFLKKTQYDNSPIVETMFLSIDHTLEPGSMLRIVHDRILVKLS